MAPDIPHQARCGSYIDRLMICIVLSLVCQKEIGYASQMYFCFNAIVIFTSGLMLEFVCKCCITLL
jgi:hypothetical protein